MRGHNYKSLPLASKKHTRTVGPTATPKMNQCPSVEQLLFVRKTEHCHKWSFGNTMASQMSMHTIPRPGTRMLPQVPRLCKRRPLGIINKVTTHLRVLPFALRTRLRNTVMHCENFLLDRKRIAKIPTTVCGGGGGSLTRLERMVQAVVST